MQGWASYRLWQSSGELTFQRDSSFYEGNWQKSRRIKLLLRQPEYHIL